MNKELKYVSWKQQKMENLKGTKRTKKLERKKYVNIVIWISSFLGMKECKK
jgi:hypothetical protein